MQSYTKIISFNFLLIDNKYSFIVSMWVISFSTWNKYCNSRKWYGAIEAQRTRKFVFFNLGGIILNNYKEHIFKRSWPGAQRQSTCYRRFLGLYHKIRFFLSVSKGQNSRTEFRDYKKANSGRRFQRLKVKVSKGSI